MAATAFDPDKFLAETGGFDPDKFLADTAEPMTERQKLQAQGKQSVEKRMAAEPEYVEVPIYGPDGAATGATERVMKPKADPIGAGVLSTLPFGEDIGAFGRSTDFKIPFTDNVFKGSGRTMSEEKDIGEGVREATKEAYPGAYRAGQVGGFLPALALPMGLAGRATSFAGKTALGALEGAGYGGAMGFGEGNTLEERLAAAKSGAIGGGLLGGALGRFAAPAEKAVAPVIPESVQAAERMGVEMPYYAITESPVAQRLTKLSESIPMAGEPVAAARQKAITQLEDAVDALVPKMTTEQAGEKIGAGIKGWMTSGVREKAKSAYDEVAGLFENPGVTKSLENTTNAVADIMAKRAKTGMEGVPTEISSILGSIQKPGGLDYDSAKYLLSDFRTKYVTNNLNKTIDEVEVNKIYRALRNDVMDIAEEAGGAPARFFLQKADREYQKMSAMREQLAKIVGKKDEAVSDEQIFNKLFNASRDGGSANNKLVQRAITVMEPAQLKAFQAGILSKLGRDAQGNFSPDRWLGAKGINALSPRAKAMIFKDEPRLVQALNDVTTISERFKNLNKFGNPSGTSQGIFGGLTITSMIHSPIKTLAAIAGANGFTRIMSKPATAQGFADWARRYENFVRFPTEQSGKLAYRAGQQLNRMIAEEAGKQVDVNDYLNKGP